MNKQDKKDLIQKTMDSGDRRSYNELVADLELAIWRLKQQGKINFKITKF